MSRPTLIAFGIVLAIIVGGVGMLAYSYAQISVSLDDVNFHSIDWTDFTFSDILSLGGNLLSGNVLGFALDLIDGINLNLIFGLSNDGFLPAYIPDITYDLVVNGISVGQGRQHYRRDDQSRTNKTNYRVSEFSEKQPSSGRWCDCRKWRNHGRQSKGNRAL